MLLASLATSAYFFAQGTTSLIASRLFGIDEAEPGAAGRTPRRAAAPAPTLARRAASAATILERNIFEPPSLLPDAGVGEVAAVAPGETIDSLGDRNAPPCPADHRLTGAVVNPAMPSWSYAALSQGQTPAILHRVGQTFASKTVALIQTGFDPDEPLLPGAQHRPRIRVVLQDAGGVLCQVTMFAPAGQPNPTSTAVAAGAPAAVQAPGAPAVPPASPAAGDISATELDQGITRVSDTQFTVQRAMMERALAQQDSLFRSARLIPTDDGETGAGMKIYGIRRSSILGRLGLQNGDVLGNVNGQAMGSADALIQAYQSLGRSGTFSVSVTRRGQPMTINYQVQ